MKRPVAATEAKKSKKIVKEESNKHRVLLRKTESTMSASKFGKGKQVTKVCGMRSLGRGVCSPESKKKKKRESDRTTPRRKEEREAATAFARFLLKRELDRGARGLQSRLSAI